jgi:hypothetical protein
MEVSELVVGVRLEDEVTSHSAEQVLPSNAVPQPPRPKCGPSDRRRNDIGVNARRCKEEQWRQDKTNSIASVPPHGQGSEFQHLFPI